MMGKRTITINVQEKNKNTLDTKRYNIKTELNRVLLYKFGNKNTIIPFN